MGAEKQMAHHQRSSHDRQKLERPKAVHAVPHGEQGVNRMLRDAGKCKSCGKWLECWKEPSDDCGYEYDPGSLE